MLVVFYLKTCKLIYLYENCNDSIWNKTDFIRMSAIFKKLDENFNHILVHTGQHYDKLLSGVLKNSISENLITLLILEIAVELIITN